MTNVPPPPPPPPPARSVEDRSADDAATDESPGSHWLRVALMGLALVVLVRYTGWWGLVIVAGLVVMIFLHELGHFIMAKRAGMKVTEFFIGFGPRLWSFKRGETEYGFKAIPAGAYVKIIGMSMAEEVDPADEPRTYRAQPFWQRFGVAVAGSTMHFIQALVLIFVILVFTGSPGGALARPVSGSTTTQIGDVYANCPAAAAGIRPDDEVLAIDGRRLTHYSQLGTFTRDLAGKDADFLIRRDGVESNVVVHVIPRDDGVDSPGLLGVNYGPKPLPVERTGPVQAIPDTFVEFGYLMKATIPAFFKAFSPSNLRSYTDQVTNANRDRNAADTEAETSPTTILAPSSTTPSRTPTDDSVVTTSACKKSMGGPAAFTSTTQDTSAQEGRFLSIVGIFNIGKGMTSSGGVMNLLFLFVIVNLFIGVFNLIPMLPFDGGHVVIAMYEKVQEWRRHTGERYYADLNKLLPVVYVMVVLLGLLFVSSLYLDIVNPLSVK